MCSLEEILKEWSRDADKRGNQRRVKNWMKNHKKTNKEFIDNLLEERELSRTDAEALAYALLEIAKLPNISKKLTEETNDKIIEKQQDIFEKWAAVTRLNDRACDGYKQEGCVYHITTGSALRDSIESHRTKVSDRDLLDPAVLADKIKKLSNYSDLENEKIIWVTWRTNECACHSVIDVYTQMTSDRTTEKDDYIDENMHIYRESIMNALALKKTKYETEIIIILCYEIPQDLTIKVPTIAHAGWNNCGFKPKEPNDNCGKSRAVISCNEGVHGNINLSKLKGVAILPIAISLFLRVI